MLEAAVTAAGTVGGAVPARGGDVEAALLVRPEIEREQPAVHGVDVAGEQLDRHLAGTGQVGGRKYGPRATAPDQTVDAVGTVEFPAQVLVR